jgi:hypothetical protein
MSDCVDFGYKSRFSLFPLRNGNEKCVALARTSFKTEIPAQPYVTFAHQSNESALGLRICTARSQA